MIIRSKDKVQVGGKNKPVWVLYTDALTVTHNTADAEPSVTTFSSDHIKYHLHYLAEYRHARLKKLVNDGTILSYLTDLDRSVSEAIECQVYVNSLVDTNNFSVCKMRYRVHYHIFPCAGYAHRVHCQIKACA